MSFTEPYVCMQTHSSCYKGTSHPMQIKGVLWHSTGANNPYVKRYVQPYEGDPNYNEAIAVLGKNKNHNDWNHVAKSAGLNAWIGKFADGHVGTVQTMPWDYMPWGCGAAYKGGPSCNNGWIQFEICEDGLTDKNYAQQVWDEAVQFTAYLCKKFNLDPMGTAKCSNVTVPVITCHNDAAKLKVACNHADINHWFPKLLGKNMENARQEVKALLDQTPTPAPTPQPTPTPEPSKYPTPPFTVQVLIDDLNIRKGPGTNYKVVGQTGKGKFTIIEVNGDWGLLKSKAGWIYLANPTYVKIDGQPASQPINKSYKVKVTATVLNIRKGPGTNYPVIGTYKKNDVCEVIEEKDGWGRTRRGWICLAYTQKI